MLPNPLTPPDEHSAEAVAADDGGASVLGANEPVTQLSVATPESNVNMGLNGLDEMSDVDSRQEVHSDEDQSMSEGGAPLGMTLSHAEALNAELDMLDAELMGPENLANLFMDTHFPDLGDQYPDPFQEPDEHQDSPMDQPQQANDVYMHGPGSLVNLPSAMSAVSLHLQHLQEAQEHAEAADDLHGANLNHSTPSILLNFINSLNHDTLEAVVNGTAAELLQNAQLHAGTSGPPILTQPWPHAGPPTLEAVDAEAAVPLQSQFLITANPPAAVADNMSDADQNEVEEPFNLSLADFLYNWGMSSQASNEDTKRRPRGGPDLAAISRQRNETLIPVRRFDLCGAECDEQRINWEELGVSRSEARQMRRNTYKNYQNLRLPLQWHPRLNGARLEAKEAFFQFRRTDFSHDVHLSHFQLRNLMACASRDHIYYVGRSKIMHWQPRSGTSCGKTSVAMDLTDPIVQPFYSNSNGIQITTMAIAHNILVAGGFCGEYAVANLRQPKDEKHAEGQITDHMNSITNHVQVHLSRSSSLPVAAFASNDMGMRFLDINTNTFIAEHKYEHAINCSAISPDQRLRVMVGDTRQVMICNAETGEVLQSLEGHRDFGFACDWADDGWTVATGNQDMQVKIWDARKWTSSQGEAQPVATIATELAGVRQLKFSPLGSGKKVLLAVEPADIISVIDADTFTSKQTLTFFGEIGGVDFTNGGRDLFVANCDSMRGGIMEYERCDFAGNDYYELEEYNSKNERRWPRGGDGYDWISDDAMDSHPKTQGTSRQRARQAATASLECF